MTPAATATNSERFLSAFGAIEYQLRTLTGLEKRTRFYTLVDKGAAINPAVRRYSDDLKEFADLRNAIVHERTDEHVLAEPNDRAVRQIEHIQQLLDNPPRVIPTFQKRVYGMTVDDPIAAAAFLMRQYGFSQLPIYNGKGFRALLSTDDITRWLGECAPTGTVDLNAVTVARVLDCHCKEIGKNYEFFRRDDTLFAVLETFQHCEHCGRRLDAILITEHGNPSEDLLGIITIWDLPQLYAAVDERAQIVNAASGSNGG
jgi:CBS domain-containing protein